MAQEYVTIDMEIDINKPAAEVWEKVSNYCAIGSEWLRLPCEITSGSDGGMGSVRSLMGGRVIEIMVAQTALSMGIRNLRWKGSSMIFTTGLWKQDL